MSKYRLKYRLSHECGEFEPPLDDPLHGGLTDGFLFVSVLFGDPGGVSIVPIWADGRSEGVMKPKDKFSVWALITSMLQEEKGLTVNQYHVLHDTHEKLKELAIVKGLQNEKT